MMNIEILFFGKLKETWNTSSLNYQTETTTIETLYTELLDKVLEPPYKASIKVAINDEFVTWDSLFSNGDTIAFLPPASGG